MGERELFIEYMLNENPTNNVEFMEEFGWFYDPITELRWLSWKAALNRQGYKLVPTTPTMKVYDRLFAEHDLDEDRITYIYKDIIDASE